MDSKELLALYRRKVRLATNTTNESVAPSNNVHLEEVSKIHKELLKRLGGVSILVFTDYGGGMRVIAPFFSEEERDRWLTDFWEKFREKYGEDCIRELPTVYKNINLDQQPVDPETFLKLFVRNNGAHIVV